ncbi:MAG: hypothetical protein HN576_13365 [Bacteriovoracaceae bacterium]|jgi:hypothetical protein|nr:hypothetical protein [Bacteriovoracaceae bacterium]
MKSLIIIGLALSFSSLTQASVTIKNCNSSQVETIRTIHTTVSRKVREITSPRTGVSLYNLSYIKSEYIGPRDLVASAKFKNADRTYTTFHNKVKLVLNQVKSKINGTYKYVCDSARTRNCRGGEVTAYVLFLGNNPYNRINLCPLFFQSSTYDQEDTLLHELTHLAGKTDHYMGTSMTDAGMIKSANNAYLYGGMMHRDFEKVMRGNSWGLMWRGRRPNLVEL